MKILGGWQFSVAQHKWRYCKDMGKEQFVGNGATLVVRENDSLTINIVLSERVTAFSAVVRKQ
jgi:hypothetical protein